MAKVNVSLDEELLNKLIYYGIIPTDEVRTKNEGESNYSKRIIQPWSIWIDWDLNPWEADIIKRVKDRGKGEDRCLDLRKIIHDCNELIRQIESKKLLSID